MPKGVYDRKRLTGTLRNPYGESKPVAPKAIAEDPLIQEAERANEEQLQGAVGLTGVSGTEDLTGAVVPSDPYEHIGSEDETEIGNGGTIPFRYRGRPTQMFTTCSEPEPNKNRGCPFFFRCPLRNRGPFNLIFKDKKSGQVRAEICSVFVNTGMISNRNFALLPGVDYFYSEDVDWAPFPKGHPKEGQMPEAGPGKPKTHIVHTPAKNHMTHVPDADLVRQYEELRVRGEAR